jgi:hypothetical protein
MREIQSGGSYLSQSDLRANFGLGKTNQIDAVEVSWPSGAHGTYKNVDADRFYLIEEGSDRLDLQKFVRGVRNRVSKPKSSPNSKPGPPVP